MEGGMLCSLDHCVWLIDNPTLTPQAFATLYLYQLMVNSCNWKFVYEEY